jgi:soluble lytic murein transglycosylase-like protein
MTKETRIALHLSRAFAAAKAGFALIGLMAVFALTVVPLERHLLIGAMPRLVEDALSKDDSQSLAAMEPLAQSGAPRQVQELEQQALAEFISRRWRIAESAASSFVSIAYQAGKQHSVDPVLILAVMAIESRYNPIAESAVGAKGLMQVIPRFHMEKLADHGGEEALLNPEVNIHVGARILREYYRRFGDQELALQMYAGAFDDPGSQYTNKVYAERDRLEPVRQRVRKQTARSA